MDVIDTVNNALNFSFGNQETPEDARHPTAQLRRHRDNEPLTPVNSYQCIIVSIAMQ